MQGAGDEQRGGHGQNAAENGIEIEPIGEPIHQRAEGAHHRADQRKRPARARDAGPFAERRMHQRQPGAEG